MQVASCQNRCKPLVFFTLSYQVIPATSHPNVMPTPCAPCSNCSRVPMSCHIASEITHHDQNQNMHLGFCSCCCCCKSDKNVLLPQPVPFCACLTRAALLCSCILAFLHLCVLASLCLDRNFHQYGLNGVPASCLAASLSFCLLAFLPPCLAASLSRSSLVLMAVMLMQRRS